MSEKQFFTVNAKGDEAELLIYEEIGEGWFGGVGAKGFASQLTGLPKSVSTLHVRINSVGGNAYDGAAIYNSLKKHPAKKHVHIDGAAISAASEIAMSGDEIEMADNAVMMIHFASGATYGKSEELRNYANLLDKVNDGLVKVYAARTGKSEAEIIELLHAETWFNAQEAVENGFATKVSPAKAMAATFDPKNLKNVPEWCKGVLRPAPDNHVPPAKEPPKMADDLKPADPATAAATVAPNAIAEAAALEQLKATAREEGIAAENQRVTEITAMCETAKLPGEAKKLIADNKMSVEAARKYLFEAMCQQRPAVGDEGGEGEPAPKDENAAYKKEYADNKAYFVKTGTTEEQYVRTRRIDDGLDPLILRASA